MRVSEDRPGPLVTCTGNTGRSPVLTGELVPVDWHGLPVRPPRTSTGRPCKPEQLTTFPLAPTVQTVISTFQGLAPGTYGALDRGSPMLYVDFKKW